MKDKDYFKIKIRKCRIKTPDMSIIEQEFKSPPPKGVDWNLKPFENINLRVKTPALGDQTLTKKHSKKFFFRFHKTNYEDNYSVDQVKKISRLLLEKPTISSDNKSKANLFKKTYFNKKKELLNNTGHDDFYITKTKLTHILDNTLRYHTELDHVLGKEGSDILKKQGNEIRNKLLKLKKKNKDKPKNLSAYINSMPSNEMSTKSNNKYQSYLITEVNPNKTTTNRFIETQLTTKNDDNNLSIESYSDEGEIEKEIRQEKISAKYQKELDTKFNFYKPSKEALEAYRNSSKNSIRGKTTSSLYRTAIDRYENNINKNKKNIKFNFTEEYKSLKTNFFSTRDKVNREIAMRNNMDKNNKDDSDNDNYKNRNKDVVPEVYRKHIKEIDKNEIYLQKLPFHNINDHLKKDWKRVKDILLNKTLDKAGLEQLEKQKRENLNILKDFKSINLSKIEFICRNNLSRLDTSDKTRIDKTYNTFLNSSKFEHDAKKVDKVSRRYELRQNILKSDYN